MQACLGPCVGSHLAKSEIAVGVGLEEVPKWLLFFPCFLVLALLLGLGVWYFHWRGWRVQPEAIGFAIVGGWGAISAVKDSFKLEPPFRWVLTGPVWLLRKLKWNDALVWSLFAIVYSAVLAVVALAALGFNCCPWRCPWQ